MVINIKKNYFSIDGICVLLFQLSVIADTVLGLEPTFYVVSKAIIVMFWACMTFRLIQEKKFQPGTSLLFPFLFMLWTALSVIWAAYPDLVISKLKTEMQLFALFFFVYHLFKVEKADLKKYMDAVYVSGLLMVVYALYKYNGLNGFIEGMNSGQRMGGEITGENAFGIAFSQAFLVAFYYLLKDKKMLHKIIYAVSIPVFVFFALSSGSKKAFLMIAVGVLMICVLEFGIKQIWKTLLIGGICIVLIFLALQLPIFSTINERLTSFFTGEFNTSDRNRELYREVGLNYIKSNPVFGYGIGSFGTVTNLGAYSHDNFIEIAFSTGLIGFGLYYITYLAFLAVEFSAIIEKKDYIKVLLFLMACISLIFGRGMVEFDAKSCWILLGIMASEIDKNRGSLKVWKKYLR